MQWFSKLILCVHVDALNKLIHNKEFKTASRNGELMVYYIEALLNIAC